MCEGHGGLSIASFFVAFIDILCCSGCVSGVSCIKLTVVRGKRIIAYSVRVEYVAPSPLLNVRL
jgi:hypothetical protein